MSMTVTNIDNGSAMLEVGQSEHDQLLTVAGIVTVLAGTILARKAVADAITAGAFVGTGDGTVTLATVQPGGIVPLVGVHSLVCTAAVANGGVFNLLDPNGAVIATNITLTVGAGAVTVINVAGMEFSVTDGAADFVVGDAAPLTVVSAAGKYVVFATDGVGGAQIPKAILPYAVTSTGAGDLPIDPMLEGKWRLERLVIDADGDASNIDAVVKGQLLDYGMVAVSVNELAALDNQ